MACGRSTATGLLVPHHYPATGLAGHQVLREPRLVDEFLHRSLVLRDIYKTLGFTDYPFADLTVLDQNGTCVGCIGQDLHTMEIRSFAADAVVLCTGGYGNVFFLSTNAMASNVTAAYRAYKKGALVANPCYTQIHPTCIPVSGHHQSKLTRYEPAGGTQPGTGKTAYQDMLSESFVANQIRVGLELMARELDMNDSAHDHAQQLMSSAAKGLGATISAGVEHENYSVSLDAIPGNVAASLANDLESIQ